MNYKCIMWDWNGTLLNDVHVSVAAANSMLTERTIPPITLQTYREAFTFPIRKCYEALGFDLDTETFQSVSKQYLEQYQKASVKCSLADGAEEVIKHFYSHNIEQIILSASEKQNLLFQLKYFPIGKYFSQILALDDHYAVSKVDLGKNFFAASSYSKEELLFIGDTLHDYETASEIGCDCILISNGHQDKKRLLTAGVPVIDSMSQLIALLN